MSGPDFASAAASVGGALQRLAARAESENMCGTVGGYHRHQRDKEKPCELCRAAQAGYMTAYRHRLTEMTTPPPRHGTEKALIAHWIKDENPCVVCQAWSRSYRRGLVANVGRYSESAGVSTGRQAS